MGRDRFLSLFLCLLCGPDHQIPVVYEILSANLLCAYRDIKHTFSIINISSYPARPCLAPELISCLQSLSPLKPYLNLKPSYPQLEEWTARY